MRTKIRFVILALLLVGTLAFTPVQSATADEDACAGFLVLTLGTPVTAWPLSEPVSTSFTLALVPGVCVTKAAGIVAVGTFAGWCDLAGGSGITANGHEFFFQVQGPILTFEGDELHGATLMAPNVTAGDNCVTAATSFLLAGGMVKTHFCDATATVC